MLNPGTILDDRYEIIDVVGTGGMSTVYRAKDERLKRFVAVKVLKAEYASDATFVSKFRVEAQSSAGLTHPNIVSVYDVSEDQGLYFIVMELVEGITLKEYINLNGRLNMSQAIEFSIQIASALQVAHEHHVIHRDIKPQNIIVSKSGSIKVTDFGIAKAATSTTMSTTGIGSVHYISPEQARGGYSDERSDIYSLGITMYEMVTGRVPFEGDTNVAIALMHIQNEMISPRELYPDIYPSFEKIILKCTQKKPERRYLTAAALIADLNRVKENPNIDIVVAPAGVTNAPTQMFSPDEMAKIKEQAGVKKVGDETLVAEKPDADAAAQQRPGENMARRNITSDSQDDDFFDDDDDAREPVRTNAGYDSPQSRRSSQGNLKKVNDTDDSYDLSDEDRYSDRYSNKKRYDDSDDDYDEVNQKTAKTAALIGILAALVIAIVVVIVIGNWMGWFSFGKNATTESKLSTETSSTEEEQIEMPDVVGYTQQAAEKTLKDAGFTNIKFEEKASTDTKEGYVIGSNVEKGEKVAASTEIMVDVSSGPEAKEVPDVTGMTEDEAKALLKKDGFESTSKHEYSDDVDENLIIEQSPKGGESLDEGSTVTLTVSNGPEKKDVKVPDLTNQTESAARSSIESVKLVVGNVTYEYNSNVTSGNVIRQSISGGTQTKEGTSVDIVISKGPETVKYTGSVKGSISASNSSFLTDSSVVVVTVYINDANGQHQVAQNTVNGTAAASMNVSGSSDGLTANNGTVSFTVVDSAGNNLSSYYTSNLTLSYSGD